MQGEFNHPHGTFRQQAAVTRHRNIDPFSAGRAKNNDGQEVLAPPPQKAMRRVIT